MFSMQTSFLRSSTYDRYYIGKRLELVLNSRLDSIPRGPLSRVDIGHFRCLLVISSDFYERFKDSPSMLQS